MMSDHGSLNPIHLLISCVTLDHYPSWKGYLHFFQKEVGLPATEKSLVPTSFLIKSDCFCMRRPGSQSQNSQVITRAIFPTVDVSGREQVPKWGRGWRTVQCDPAMEPFPGMATECGNVCRTGQGLSGGPTGSSIHFGFLESEATLFFSIRVLLPLLGKLADLLLACWLETHGQQSLAFL